MFKWSRTNYSFMNYHYHAHEKYIFSFKLLLEPHVTLGFIMRVEDVKMMYSIGQFAKKTGMTIRTLHYYDEKGLLKPARISKGGQRYYDESNILTVQKIATYKYLDFSIEEIKQLLKEESSLVDSLQQQKLLLEKKKKQLDQIIASLDTAITIHKQVTVQEPAVLLSVLHSLLTEDQQKDYLYDVLPKALVDELYESLGEDVVEINRKYIEYTFALKDAYKKNIEGEHLKELILQLLMIIPRDLAQKFSMALEEYEVTEIDEWLFPSLFTPEEDRWLTESMEKLNLMEVFIDETTTK